MRQLSKIGINLLWLIGAVIMFSGCEKDPNIKIYQYPAHSVSGLSPAASYPNTYITITGKDFGTLKDAVKVFFGDVKADSIISCQDEKIVVKVPATAISGKVTLKVWTTTSEVGTFTVLPVPTITSVSLRGASVGDGAMVNSGDTLSVKGTNFNSNMSVLFGSTAATVIPVSAGEIKVIIPVTSSGNLKIVFDTQVINGPYLLIGLTKLTGTIIGHSGSWGNNPATFVSAAFDGNTNTFVDGNDPSGYAGFDLGAGVTASVEVFKFFPRSNFASRMVGGQLRGTNDPTRATYDILYTITAAPAATAYTTVSISNTNKYRYIYYYSGNGNCNVAELEFYGRR